MAPLLAACYFAGSVTNGEMFGRMARVLRATAAEHCVGWDVCIQRISPAPLPSLLGVPSLVHNTQKMYHWHHAVQAAPEGAQLLLIDSDVVILRPLDDVWSLPFDLAYTSKPSPSRFPFNSGVVFLRVSARVRAFVAAWWAENRRMLEDSEHHQVWRRRFGGINQAALGQLLTEGRTFDLDLLQLPCAEWNCEDYSWPSFDPAVTRVLHVKGALRHAIFHEGRVDPHMVPLVALWRQIEARCREAVAS